MKSVEKISIDLIKANRFQPRTVFDDEKLMELAQSIRENGLIQPIVVRQDENMYEIIAGERRFRACILAGLTEIDAIIKDAGEQELTQMALVENIQRENLTAIEEAKAYYELLNNYDINQSELAQQMGKSQSTIANKLRLLNLHQEVQNAVASRQISERHARALLLIDHKQQVELLDIIINNKMTVSDTEKMIKRIIDYKPKRKPLTKGYSRNHQLVINTINEAVEMTKNFGIKTNIHQEEDDKTIKMIITIEK